MARAQPEASLAADIGAFVAGLDDDSVPDDARRTAERAILDTVGVTLAGGSAGAAPTAMAIAAADAGETTLFGRETRSSLLSGAFANAVVGHTLDFDDTALSATDGHPSVPMVAPLFALGERAGASGPEVLVAYVAGYETQAAINAPLSPGHYEAGWHATATIGTFGAAAAAASLLELSPERVADALSIAASMSAGLKRNFGTQTKSVHAGQAARSGLTAALLAEGGVDADAAALEGDRGFFDLYAGEDGIDRSAFPDLGEGWAIRTDGPDVKTYPCCYYTHTAIEATAALVASADLGPREIDRIEVTASRGAADALQHHDPETGFEAKFSMPYTVAYAAVEGRVDLAAFDGGPSTDPAVERVRDRVSLDVDESLPYDSTRARVVVYAAGGERHERTVDRPPGTHDDPLPDADLHRKFERCARRAIAPEATAEAIEVLDDLRSVDDLGTVTALLRG